MIEMEQLIEAQPWGFCPACLTKFLDAELPIEGYRLSDASVVIAAFCAERSIGASLHLRDGKPQRWHIVSPIDALEWRGYLAAQLGAREALGAAAAADRSGAGRSLNS